MAFERALIIGARRDARGHRPSPFLALAARVSERSQKPQKSCKPEHSFLQFFLTQYRD
jgi:hypothetical protein